MSWSPRRLPATLAIGLGLALGVTACGGSSEPPTAPPGADVVVTGDNAFRFDPDEFTATAGDRIGLVCVGSLPHNLVVATEAEDVEVVECGGLESAVGVLDVEPGQYEFFCSIPGHREAGMVGVLTVQ